MLVHELNEDDFDRRLEFCEKMMNRIDNDPDFLFNIVFSDEATFQLSGECNRQNCRYWSDTNPFWMRESKTQYPQKPNPLSMKPCFGTKLFRLLDELQVKISVKYGFSKMELHLIMVAMFVLT